MAGNHAELRSSGTGALLAFTAGFVDTLGFVALFGLFTAHVTGNFVLIGATLATEQQGILAKLIALPVFVLVVALVRLYVLRREGRGKPAATPLLLGQVVFLAAFLAAGVLATPVTAPDAPLAILVGMMGVSAMAIQNAASRTAFAALAPTTVMTGNVTQMVIDLVDLAAGRGGKEIRGRLVKMAPAVAAFALGALAGALGYLAFGFPALAVPIAATAAVLFLCPRAAAG